MGEWQRIYPGDTVQHGDTLRGSVGAGEYVAVATAAAILSPLASPSAYFFFKTTLHDLITARANDDGVFFVSWDRHDPDLPSDWPSGDPNPDGFHFEADPYPGTSYPLGGGPIPMFGLNLTPSFTFWVKRAAAIAPPTPPPNTPPNTPPQLPPQTPPQPPPATPAPAKSSGTPFLPIALVAGVIIMAGMKGRAHA